MSTALTAVSDSYLNWALLRGRRSRNAHDSVFPIGYPESEGVNVTGLPDSLRHRGISPDDFIVLFVGSFASSFDFKTVIQVARRLPEFEHKPLKFVFVGAGPYKKIVSDAERNLSNVVCLDWISQKSELAEIISAAHAGLCPYRKDCTMSLPNKPFEFMAAGKPVLSSLEGEFHQILESNRIGYHYRSDSADELRGALTKMLEKPREREEMARNARRLFEERFVGRVIYPKYVAALESIAARGRS